MNSAEKIASPLVPGLARDYRAGQGGGTDVRQFAPFLVQQDGAGCWAHLLVLVQAKSKNRYFTPPKCGYFQDHNFVGSWRERYPRSEHTHLCPSGGGGGEDFYFRG